ncbi:MAG: sulfotransferase [Spirochaetes bacterium]|nr:sulfotransferase [Spirochaetota bacterium]
MLGNEIKNIFVKMQNMIKILEISKKNRLKLRKSSLSEVNNPMILISQIQRSGGTLLSQLFDGHHQCLSYPNELHWGIPEKWNWPDISSFGDDSQKIFYSLWKDDLAFIKKYIVGGYSKYSRKKKDETYPFFFDLKLHKDIFFSSLRQLNEDTSTQRDYLNIYMTAFFNAWIDYQNLYQFNKYIFAFIPRLNMYNESVASFFRDYPKGFLITMIRNPLDWYASAKKHGYYKLGINESLKLWKQSALSSIELSKKDDKVILIFFEDLVNSTEIVLKYLCDILNLEWNSILLKPTFNSKSIYSDSSFEPKKGIDTTVVNRKNHDLFDEEIEIIKEYQDFFFESKEKLNLKYKKS